jgi:hypothetical protein
MIKVKKDALVLMLIFALQFVVWFFISQKIKPDFDALEKRQKMGELYPKD